MHGVREYMGNLCIICSIDVVNGGSCACMVSETIWEISVSFAQFFCAPNIETLLSKEKKFTMSI